MKLGDILVCLDPTDAGEHRLHLAATIAASTRRISPPLMS